MTCDIRRFSDILNYWHKIEFFNPFSLSNVTANHGDDEADFYVFRNVPLAPADFPIPPNKAFKGGDLYLGLFDKDDVQELVSRLGEETEIEALDREERGDDGSFEKSGDLKATTCFAQIRINASGEPQLTSVDVSTFPWAIGHALSGHLADLTSQAFEHSKIRLAERLFNFEIERRTAIGVKSSDDPAPLRGCDIEPLLNIFCEWANYWPSSELPIALFHARHGKVKETALNDAEQANYPNEHTSADNNHARIPRDDNNELLEAEDEDGDGTSRPEIGILNSFYLSDLELAIKNVSNGALPDTLRDYLTPRAPQDRIDIDTEAGRSQIIEMLQPDHLNLGRWPTNPAHAMSLMQQFSINAAFRQLQNGGVFSVNGPPGTGKTTLLRDVIAENIVRRAQILARFDRPEQAFVSHTDIIIGDNTYKVANLHPDLTGYEMVVASSNNTAVENISKDLPKAASVFMSEKEGLSYLQPVAHKLAAEWIDRAGHTRFNALNEQDMPWGMIACALGKRKNARAFRERTMTNKIAKDAHPTWSGDERPRTLWEWRERHKKTSTGKEFSKARADFQAMEQQVLQRQRELQKFADLHQELLAGRQEHRVGDLKRQTSAMKDELDMLERRISDVQRSLTTHEDQLSELKELQVQIDRLRPSFFASLFQRGRKCEYDEHAWENANEQIRLRKEILRLKHCLKSELTPKQMDVRKTMASHDAKLKSHTTDREKYESDLASFRQKFPNASLINTVADIAEHDIQRNGLWHDEKFNTLRSNLFTAAMKLHEAWLAHVMVDNKIDFKTTMWAVGLLLDGKQPEDAAHVQMLWQNFFMIVPVVSTTFASFSRQFRGLGEASLGWVLIDEAGQSVPQAAVGAMFRARRALVIGDPLQIEPIITLAQPLIKALCELSEHTRDEFYSPGKTSAQVLSDAANIYGGILNAGEKEIWVGSPLRVHRRCVDPMFSLANAIAYNDKMVHASSDPAPGGERSPVPIQSCWVDIGGKVADKQIVPAQIEFASRVVIDCYNRDGALPHLYLISPFKKIKYALNRRLASKEAWAEHGSKKPAGISDWLKSHVGTVHTFQGKEEDTVVMVLGVDAENPQAADWAALKPNILNVAITRAKRRFYIVGDKKVWGERRYFNQAATMLSTITAEMFIEQNQNSQRKI